MSRAFGYVATGFKVSNTNLKHSTTEIFGTRYRNDSVHLFGSNKEVNCVQRSGNRQEPDFGAVFQIWTVAKVCPGTPCRVMRMASPSRQPMFTGRLHLQWVYWRHHRNLPGERMRLEGSLARNSISMTKNDIKNIEGERWMEKTIGKIRLKERMALQLKNLVIAHRDSELSPWIGLYDALMLYVKFKMV